jgi:riboflavin synthase
MPETLRVTNFNEIKEGDEVNLEKSLKMNGRLDGHFVLGHVDGVGRVLEIREDGEFIEVVINAPENLRKYLARKGTVVVNGVSLTISEDLGDKFKVSLITHTREVTNFKNIKVGDAVNLEIDMIVRYMEKIIMSNNRQNNQQTNKINKKQNPKFKIINPK